MRSTAVFPLAGVAALAVLEGCFVASDPVGSGVTRTYYIAADEIEWDYAPLGMNVIRGKPFGADENVFAGQSDDRIGSRYKKAVYREYTSDAFDTLAPREDKDEYRGILGPVLHAAVGDTLSVVFRNNGTIPYSMHPHGVFYDKGGEGARYSDKTKTAQRADDIVMPGDTFTYEWEVPESAGPGPRDTSSVVWLYHSHVDTVADINAGLAGAIVVTGSGAARQDGTPSDVDREVISLFTVHDENASHFIEDNIRTYTKARDPAVLMADDAFVESNLMHTINGYVWGNGPELTLRQGEHVRWYLLAVGTEVDLHTAHWHGHTALHRGHRVDVVELLPASMHTTDLLMDNPGRWMFHCHVHDHIAAGMISLYDVIK
ncbi:MAG: multicopper oxidase domain-containing protein [Proteobacteria bacterium]|nr:multicopper oxidase domain-containing protein [Pseudomonadota bacterium]